MRTLLFITLTGFAAAGFAQEKPPADKEQQQQIDKETQERLRAERSAGGVRQITPEEKQGAAAGAGTHRQSRPGGAAPREPTEESSKEESSNVQSGNAGPDARRP